MNPTADPRLARALAAAGLPTTGHFVEKGGWVSHAWIGDDVVVRASNGAIRDAYRHEAEVVDLLAGSDVPHARRIAHGDEPDGAWSVSTRLPGRTLQDAWPTASPEARRTMIESLGSALRELHRVPAPADLMPPWLADALAGGSWPAYHPPVVGAAEHLVDEARHAGGDAGLFEHVARWVDARLPLFADDRLVLVHGDLHGSNVMVDQGRVTGLIDFAEAVAQPADVELDTILRWCARPLEFPATPDGRGLDASTLAEVPGWLRGAYPELFAREHLRERLRFFDMEVELAILAHHPDPTVREVARGRVTRLLEGHDHLDELVW
ncbi:phosphotransferase family protein [Curtobacterium sp. ZW137]|uniref:phosphotransferase family protein n=1 Tax=Curtobacterium sp. ZW137 TaxID=2485104 RepID=UPI000FC37DBD|nr:aminoglycoside phosphotransferase family protein [Curtobacterium sp. ZW137]ROP60887.1 aminoglycoside phosphotransferase (APT) family kinase protein [Curtobacterium sp. ZW137]